LDLIQNNDGLSKEKDEVPLLCVSFLGFPRKSCMMKEKILKTIKFLTFLSVAMVCLLLESAWSVPKMETSEIESFRQRGQLLSLDKLFQAVRSSTVETTQKISSLGVVLVTETGVYSFLETPENEKHLEGVTPDTFVEITGRLLISGQLLQIQRLNRVTEENRPQINLQMLREKKGQPVKLVGKNLCQCGLAVGSLAHSCQLGHLHHLQTSEGKIYHYLPGGDGSALFLGGPNHFKTVEITGQEFPGHYLLVTSSRRLQ
jgi:hypothetical protein